MFKMLLEQGSVNILGFAGHAAALRLFTSAGVVQTWPDGPAASGCSRVLANLLFTEPGRAGCGPLTVVRQPFFKIADASAQTLRRLYV